MDVMNTLKSSEDFEDLKRLSPEDKEIEIEMEVEKRKSEHEFAVVLDSK